MHNAGDPADAAVARELVARWWPRMAPVLAFRRQADDAGTLVALITEALRAAHTAGRQAGRKEEREACARIATKLDLIGIHSPEEYAMEFARHIRARTGAEE